MAVTLTAADPLPDDLRQALAKIASRVPATQLLSWWRCTVFGA